MNSYPVFEAELEKSLKEDVNGGFLHEFQDALREFRDAVETHLDKAGDKETFARWRCLQDAAELSSEAAVKIRNHLMQA